MMQRWLRPVRIITAIIVLTGFLLLFSDVKGKLPSGFFDFFTSWQFIPSVLKFLAVPGILAAGFIIILVITLLYGRVYCSFLCPLGILQDAISKIRSWLPFKTRRMKYQRPKNLIRYPVLIVVIISLLFTGILALNLLDPYANFGRIASNLYQPVLIFGRNLLSGVLMKFDIYTIQPVAQKAFHPLSFIFSASVLLLIVILVLERQRIFCNTLCPVGTLLGLLSKFSFKKIQISPSKCTRCGKCQAVCKSACINIKQMEVDETRCVACYNCISICEESGITYKNSSKIGKTHLVADSSKRNFLKAGLFFLGTPLLAFQEKISPRLSFETRGPVSPPGSGSIRHLKDKCVACQLCISACPSKVLQPAALEYGFTGMMLPRMDYVRGFCNYECTKCGEVCPSGAILPLSREEKKVTQIGKVFFERELCIVKTDNTACGSCSEHCPTQAVYMVPYHSGLTIPETNTEICIGCGACEYACPADKPHVAIYVISEKNHGKALRPIHEKVETTETEDFPF